MDIALNTTSGRRQDSYDAAGWLESQSGSTSRLHAERGESARTAAQRRHALEPPLFYTSVRFTADFWAYLADIGENDPRHMPSSRGNSFERSISGGASLSLALGDTSDMGRDAPDDVSPSLSSTPRPGRGGKTVEVGIIRGATEYAGTGLPPVLQPGAYIGVDCMGMGMGMGMGIGANMGSNGKVMPLAWRMRDRMKTSCVALILCLNIGTDPPDVRKPKPCAVTECWTDPRGATAHKALVAIGKALQGQYERLQPRARYRQSLDPTAEDARKLCASLRRSARRDRVLLHYNGHGVPRPTPNGEIWVFNKNYTQYIPLSVHEMQQWVGRPAVYVFDCSNAGVLLPHFLQNANAGGDDGPGGTGPGAATPDDSGMASNSASAPAPSMANGPNAYSVIVLAACGANELLPMNPDQPADLFTACLTTPIAVALRWFVSRNSMSMGGLSPDAVLRIPGKLTDRKTPLGELNWVFTAVTDTIAWNTLPQQLFQRLFRQDLLVASLFRNFLLAERVMNAFRCTPTSIPALPRTHHHPLWQAWDVAAEVCLSKLLHAGVFGQVEGVVPMSMQVDDHGLDMGARNGGHPVGGLGIGTGMSVPAPMGMGLTLAGGATTPSTPRRAARAGREPPSPARLGRGNSHDRGGAEVSSASSLGSAKDAGAERGGGGKLTVNEAACEMAENAARHGNISVRVGAAATASSRGAATFATATAAAMAVVASPGGAGSSVVSGLPGTSSASGASAASSVVTMGGSSSTVPAATSAAAVPGAGGAGVANVTPNPTPAPQLVVTVTPSSFFAEQLTAFEQWLVFGAEDAAPPEQLPIVLQVLLSQAHRLRALLLLRRFLDLGPWAAGLALSVGIFPYVLKLLQSPAPELRQVLVCIWAKLLAVDPSCRAELLKEGAHVHFVAHLRALVPDVKQSCGDGGTAWRVGARSSAASALGSNASADGSVLPPLQRVMAVFILTSLMEQDASDAERGRDESAAASATSSSSPRSESAESAKRNKGRALCLEQGLHIVCFDILASVRSRPRRGSSFANHGENSSERVGTGARGSLGTSASSLFNSDVSDGVFASKMGATNEGSANSTEQRTSRATQALEAAEPAVLRCWVLLALSSLLDSFPEARQAVLRETSRRSALRRRGAQRSSGVATSPGTSVPVPSANAATSATSAPQPNAQAQSAPGWSQDGGVDRNDHNNRSVADDESVLGSQLLDALRDVDPNVRAAATGVVGALFGCPFSPPIAAPAAPTGPTGMYGVPSPDPTPAVSPKSSSPKASLRKIYLPPGGAPLSVPLMNVQASGAAVKRDPLAMRLRQPQQHSQHLQQQERRQRLQPQPTTAQSGQAKPPVSAARVNSGLASPPPMPSRRLGTTAWNASSSSPLHRLNLWHPAVPTIADATMAVSLIWACTDCSPLVRHEAVVALARLVLRPRFIGTFAAIAQEVLWRYRAAVSAARGEAEPPSPITPATIPSDTDSHPGEEDDSAAGSDSDALHANAMLNAELSPHLGPSSAAAVAPNARPPDMPLPAQAEADPRTTKSHARTKSKGILGGEAAKMKSSAADAKPKHRRRGSAKSTPLNHSGVQIGKSIAFALFSSLSSHSHCWLQAGLNEVKAEADGGATSPKDKAEGPPGPVHQRSDPPAAAGAGGSRPPVHTSAKRSKTQHDFSSVSAAVDAAAAEAAQADPSFVQSAANIGGASPTRWAGHEQTVAVLEELASVWSAIKVVAARDPFPMVSTAARTIVTRVHGVMRQVEEAAAMAAAEEQESKRSRRGDEGDASDDERASQGSRTGESGTRPRIFSRAMSPSAEDDNGSNRDEQSLSDKIPKRRLGSSAVDAVKTRAVQAARTYSLGEDDAPTRSSSALSKHNSELRVDTSRKPGSVKGRGGLLDDMRRSLRRTMSQREPSLTERQRASLHGAAEVTASGSAQAAAPSKQMEGGQVAVAGVAPPVTSPDAVPTTKRMDMAALETAIGAQQVPVQIQPPSGERLNQATSQIQMPPQVQRQAQLQARAQGQVQQQPGFVSHGEHNWSAPPPDPEPRLPRLLTSQLFACWRLGFLSPMLAENFDVDSIDDPLSESAASAMIRWRRNERVRSDAIMTAQTMIRRQRRKVGTLAGGGGHGAAANIDSVDDRDNASGHRRAASSIGSTRRPLHKRNRSVESFAESSTERSTGSSSGRGSIERGNGDGRDWGERGLGRDRESGGTRMVQSAILDNDAEMTSLLLFHAYESALVVADERDGISIWNYRAGEKACSFSNTNATGSRVTTLGWMNENAEDALLYVGSDDGVVRVWSNLKFTPADRNRSGGLGNSHGRDSDDDKDGDESTQRFTMGNADDEVEAGQRRKTFNPSRQQRRGPGPRSALHKYSRSMSLYASMGSGVGETSNSIGARSTADLFSSMGGGLAKTGGKGADIDDRDRTTGPATAVDGLSGTAQTRASEGDIIACNENGHPRKGTGGHVGRGGGWRDGGQKQRLVSAFFAVPSLAPSLRGSGLVALWDQPRGSFVAGGNSDTLYVWDLGHEQCSSRIPTSTDSCVTSLAVSCETSSFLASASALGASPASGNFGAPSTAGIGGLAGGLFIAGCGDGSIRAYDQRLRPEISLCATFSEHRAWVVHCSVQRDGTQMVSGSVQGDVVFWDLRGRAPVSVFEVHRSPMTALAVHGYAPLFASGSHNQFIKVFDFNGDVLSTIRYHDGFLGQRIGPVSSLAFHPHKPLLAAGATDSIVSIYSTVE